MQSVGGVVSVAQFCDWSRPSASSTLMNSLPPCFQGAATVRIDFPQAHNGAIHILDYKPMPAPINLSPSSPFMRSH
jgi:hypothetical protein